MTSEPKKVLEIKKSGDVYICDYCADTFTSKRGLATHLRSCPDKPENFPEPVEEPIDVDAEAAEISVLDKLELPDDVRDLLTDTDLDARLKALIKEATDINKAKQVKDAIKKAEDDKKRKQLKQIGYMGDPVVYGSWKKVILSSIEHIASCCEREERKGFEVVTGLCVVAPNGAVYMHFKKK